MAAYSSAKDVSSGLQGTGSARDAAAVTPSDSIDFTVYPRALFVGVGGNVALVPVSQQGNETAVVFKSIPSGTFLPVQARRVNATGTTATDIVALF